MTLGAALEVASTLVRSVSLLGTSLATVKASIDVGDGPGPAPERSSAPPAMLPYAGANQQLSRQIERKAPPASFTADTAPCPAYVLCVMALCPVMYGAIAGTNLTPST